MIVSELRRYAFVSSVKCGTNTLYEFFTRYADGKRHTQPDFHNTDAGDYALKGYYTFTCVRDPYERALSIWSSMVKHDQDRYGFQSNYPEAVEDFEVFADWLVNNWESASQWALRPLSLYHGKLSGVTEFIKLENLRLDLAALPFFTHEEAFYIQSGTWEIASRNSSKEIQPFLGVSPRAAQILHDWAVIDCHAYGYPVRSA